VAVDATGSDLKEMCKVAALAPIVSGLLLDRTWPLGAGTRRSYLVTELRDELQTEYVREESKLHQAVTDNPAALFDAEQPKRASAPRAIAMRDLVDGNSFLFASSNFPSYKVTISHADLNCVQR